MDFSLHKLMQWNGVCILAWLRLGHVGASETDAKLSQYLFSNYNKHIRPARTLGDVTNVSFYLTLLQLISVTEKSEEMTTSQYVTIRWEDPRLTWHPEDFGGVTQIRLPSELFWKPDVVLYNNNDGEYDTTVPVNALLNYTGKVEWLPAAIYKSACKIKVDLFPFDWQNCTMKFRSFTYDKSELYITSTYNKVVVDTEAYRDNGEWTIIHCPIKTNEDKDDPKYQDITLYFIIQRKPLFYIINIIVPCVLISSLSVLVFYLPSGSSEKMTMSISVLLGLTVYLLLLAKRVPETSLGVPLIGAYLLFTMLTVTLSIIFSVVVLNIYHRTPSTSEMPNWVRLLFMEVLPDFLRMPKPLSTRRMLLLRKESNNSKENELSTADGQCEELKALLTDYAKEQNIATHQHNPTRINEFNYNLQAVRNNCACQSGGKKKHSQRFSQHCFVDPNEHYRYSSSQRNNHLNSSQRSELSCVDYSTSLGIVKTKSEENKVPSARNYRQSLMFKAKQLPRSKSYCFESSKNCECAGKRLTDKSDRELAASLPLLDTDHKFKKHDEQLISDRVRNRNSVRTSDTKEEEIYLYKTHNERIWCSKPRRSDMKGQTRIRSRTKPFQGLRSPHLRHRENGLQLPGNITGQKMSLKNKTIPCSRSSSGSVKHFTKNNENLNQLQTSINEEEDTNCSDSSGGELNCSSTGKLPEEAILAANAVDFIADNMKTTDKMKIMNEDWHFVATVVDRLLLWIFMFVFVSGTMYFFIKASLNAPPPHPFKDNEPKYSMCWKNDDYPKHH